MAGLPAGPPEGAAPTTCVRDGPWGRDGLTRARGNPDWTGRRVAPRGRRQGLFRWIPRGPDRGAHFAVRNASRGTRHVDSSSLRAAGHFGDRPSGGPPDRNPCDRGRRSAPRHGDTLRNRSRKSTRVVASPNRALRATRRRRAPADERGGSRRIVPTELHRTVERTRGRVREPARPGSEGEEQSVSSYRATRHPTLFRVGWNAIRAAVRNPLGGERILRRPAALSGGGVPSLHGGRGVRFLRGTREGDVGGREAGGLRHPRWRPIPQSNGNRPMPGARDMDGRTSRLPCVEIVIEPRAVWLLSIPVFTNPSATPLHGTRGRRFPTPSRLCESCSRNCSATPTPRTPPDRKSTRLNSSHLVISYAVFCLK